MKGVEAFSFILAAGAGAGLARVYPTFSSFLSPFVPSIVARFHVAEISPPIYRHTLLKTV
jgi:hypothetical protein